MDIQATKLELIKIIADIQSEVLLERLKHYLNLASEEESGQKNGSFFRGSFSFDTKNK